ncbi:BgTH12-07733 [Blumeria graminis f. sp. triticale]|uniref:BgtAcSP-30632 n=3 Tax=Blumeria graminis TaxID=34373 RepID=A0A9X9QGT3_BLUGR|nr:hypothetical protein BGT96224_AcSP30632 [Blumeria graminis f. sp. tritici 96224]CAD6506506.1 BgTH12-07733 [Blumeria graminis f. sp. triticale]VDB96356.1 BgtAcSP-30632 [Blumeria graminis f. sp. tritici]
MQIFPLSVTATLVGLAIAGSSPALPPLAIVTKNITSTVYTTRIFTLTTCNASGTCRYGHVSSTIIPISSTVIPHQNFSVPSSSMATTSKTTMLPIMSTNLPVTTSYAPIFSTTVNVTKISTITSCTASDKKCSVTLTSAVVVPISSSLTRPSNIIPSQEPRKSHQASTTTYDATYTSFSTHATSLETDLIPTAMIPVEHTTVVSIGTLVTPKESGNIQIGTETRAHKKPKPSTSVEATAAVSRVTWSLSFVALGIIALVMW